MSLFSLGKLEKLQSQFFLLLPLAFLLLTSCKSGVNVQQGPDIPSALTPTISSPSVSVPADSHHYGNNSNLLISGLCIEGARIYLTGDADAYYDCKDKIFNFTVNKTVDQTYNFRLTQSKDGKESKPIYLTWTLKSSVSPPSLTAPAISPYLSAEAILNIQGNCETGSTITLSNDGVGSTTCSGSTFSINLPKFVDGDYNIDITQSDLAGNSAQISLLWRKSALIVSPVGPQVVAGKDQVFTVTGGSENYTVTLQENNSGASFVSGTMTYTAGTLAGVTDVLRFQDSQGATEDISIQVVSDVADHFELPTDSGANQTVTVGQTFANPLKVLVVDQYSNPVSAFPVIFQVTAGDVSLTNIGLQVSGLDGSVTIPVEQNYGARRSSVTVVPSVSVLPDLAGSGTPIISMDVLGETNNSGDFDLAFDVGTNSDKLIMFDADGNGHQDAIFLNKGEPSIGVLLGQGNGFFAAMTTVTSICSSPNDIVSGDFNTDGEKDLVVLCSGPDQISFYAGVGDGTFSAPVDAALSGSEITPVGITAGLINADPFLDLAIVAVGSGVVSIRNGAGDGTFGAPTTYTVGSSPSFVRLADFDKATGNDVAVVNSASNNVSVLFNDGTGSLSPHVTFSTGVAPTGMTIADFNTDTYPDIAVANNIDNNISVLLNDQASGFNLSIDTSVGQSPSSISSLDLDGDAKIDVVVTNSVDGNLSILKGNDNGTFTIGPVVGVGSNPIATQLLDLNSDALPDIVALASGAKKLNVIPAQADGNIGFVYDVGNSPKAMAVADFNGDGFKDQAVVNQAGNSISILTGNGFGAYTPHSTLTTASGPIDISVEDLNRDGFMDLVVSIQNVNSLQIFMGEAGGTFATPAVQPTNLQPTEVLIRDFNTDGHYDLLVANSGGNKLSFFPGVGDGTFGGRSDINAGAQPRSLDAADFNLDGKLDVVVANGSGSNISIFLGNGDGSFQTSVNYPAQVGPNGVRVGYFNADPFIDVAVSNEISNSVSVMFGQGNGTLQNQAVYSVGASTSPLRLADVNDDGNLDFVVGNGLNQTATILFGSFFGDYSTSKILQTGINTSSVEISDINGDGAVDLLFIDGTNPKTKLLLGLPQ